MQKKLQLILLFVGISAFTYPQQKDSDYSSEIKNSIVEIERCLYNNMVLSKCSVMIRSELVKNEKGRRL